MNLIVQDQYIRGHNLEVRLALLYTVWKHNFSITQILCKIDFADF